MALPLLLVIFLWQDQEECSLLPLGSQNPIAEKLDLAELYSLASAELLKVQDSRN